MSAELCEDWLVSATQLALAAFLLGDRSGFTTAMREVVRATEAARAALRGTPLYAAAETAAYNFRVRDFEALAESLWRLGAAHAERLAAEDGDE